MSLYLRKMTEQHIEDSKSPTHSLLSADYYENEILDVFTRTDPGLFRWGAPGDDSRDIALGRLAVITADLLELARRADPAYGLKADG
jgi:hypothetical protein